MRVLVGLSLFLFSVFLQTILTHPRLYMTIVSPSGEGMSVSYKTR
jgi:hypothetical protein